MHKAVTLVEDCFDSGMTWKEARERLFDEVPGQLRIAVRPIGTLDGKRSCRKSRCDAPNNIGIAVIGLLYGGGDFGKSICIAVNCGEDTDCSAGFAGALLGVVMGNGGIPEKWSEVLAGVINTGVHRFIGRGFFLPKTVED